MTQQSSGIFNWINTRLPISNTYERHLSKHPVPKKVNFWYLFGALASVVLVIQIVSGIWLMFGYENTEEGAFASVEYIMRDIEYGWIIRYMHTTGASMFFAVVYLHMFRGLLYGSYHKPRELVWIFGMTIYLVMMAEGFLGYVLPYGQMSYWGAQVIISLFGAIPYIGESLELWVRGDYYISGATISRFFALHVVALPLILIALVFMHLVALHEVGAGNPDGVPAAVRPRTSRAASTKVRRQAQRRQSGRAWPSAGQAGVDFPRKPARGKRMASLRGTNPDAAWPSAGTAISPSRHERRRAGEGRTRPPGKPVRLHCHRGTSLVDRLRRPDRGQRQRADAPRRRDAQTGGRAIWPD